MEPIGCDVSSDRSGRVHCGASASDVPPTYATSSHTETPRVRSARCPGESVGTLSPVSIFFPDAFPVPGTTSPVTTAFDDGASPSNGAPHSPLTRLRSCCVGGILQCDVRLWRPAHIAQAVSQAPRWTNNNRPSRSDCCRAHGSVPPPPSAPHRLADADGCATPPVV